MHSIIDYAQAGHFAMFRLKALIPKGQFARSVSVLAGATALGQGIVALSSPILTRLYTPEDFGVLAVFVAVSSLLLTFNSLRYEFAIALPQSDADAAHLVLLVVLLLIGSTALLGVIFGLSGEAIAGLLNVPALAAHYGLLLICLFGAGVYQALNYWAIRQQAFTPIARTKVVQGAVQTLVQIGAGALALGVFGLLTGYTLGQISGSFALLRQMWARDRAAFRQITLRRLRELAVRYRKFPLFMSWSSLINAASLQLPALTLGILYGPSVAGWFLLGQRLVAIPMTLIGTSVAQVYLGAASHMMRENPAGLLPLYLSTARRLLILGGLPLLAVGVIGPWLFELVLGPAWRTSGEFVQVLVPMFIAQFIVSTLSQTIVVLERQNIQAIWDTLRLVSVLIGFGAAGVFDSEPVVAIGLYSFIMTVMYGVLFTINWRLLQNVMAEKPR
ncbi:MAG: oligosaccharide flippase family protein [Aggregatilineales bacterium]